MAAIAVTVAEEVEKKAAEYLVAWVCRHCGYLIFSNRKVRQLKDELEKLDPASQRVQHRTEVARRNMRPIEADVEKWMGEVETVTTEARDLLQDHDGRGNTTCFCGWLPNPKARYRFGKEASRMVKDIPGLIERGQFPEVAFENPPRGLVMDGAPNLIILGGHHGGTIIESRASILEDIMNALDDEKLKVIGIYGPGGVGKTTLLGEVEEKLRKEKRLFHLIAPTKVSQTPDLKNIQNDIAFALGLNLKDEPSEVGRRDLLHRKLQSDLTEKVLIILDDLWKKLDLEVVGIPSGDESSKCKLLLTSRFEDVLIEMKCAPSTSIFHLQGLKDEEAFRLFEEKVGDRLKDDEEVRAIAPEVVKKLAGLPLLINSVATTLKDSHLSAWKYASKYIDVTQMETIVKLSYDHLRSGDAKTLFRVCGLIGGTIEVQLLLGLGMGLGLFEEFNSTIEDARHKLNTMVNSLRSVCLLQEGGDDEEMVTIHDVYSEVVVSTKLGAQDSLVMNSSSWREKNLEKCWAIHLADASRDRLAKLMTCQFPELELLMLSQHGRRSPWMFKIYYDARDCCGPLDFKDMKELRVLYLRSMHIAPLPSSIQILVNLRSLYLEYCDVEDVVFLGKLKTLEILSFAGSTIAKLPEEISGLTKLRSLNLSWCSDLEIIERGALEGIINLEELYMRGSFDRWMGEDKEPTESCNARLAELKSLRKLTALEILIPDPAVLLEDGDLPVGNLIRFCINIGNVYGCAYDNAGTMMLDLSGVDSILSKEWVQKTLQRTQYLYLGGLRESKESAHELCNGGFSQLKHLIINNSTSIKYIALSAFPSLELLLLENLEYLEKICDARGEPECSGILKFITVTRCHRLKNLWCLSNQQRLVHLEEIEVKECESMQAIITYDARNVGAAAADVIVELPNVHTLDLHNLPSMTSFCIGDNGAPIQVSFPHLESLSMFGLSNLENLCRGPRESFSKLKVVLWNSCPQLKTLLNLSDKRLVHLEEIKVKECDSMQAIITYDARNVGAVAADVIVELPNVHTLDLHNLPSMMSFCIGDNGAPIQVSFPRLKSLSMFGLSNLENLCHGPPESFSKLKDVSGDSCPQLKTLLNLSDKRLVHLEEITVKECDSMQAIITYDARNVGAAAANVIVELPNVHTLDLHNLPSMTSFCIGDNCAPIQVSFPRLESLSMFGLSNLENLCHGPPESFSKLKDVFGDSCPQLKTLLNVSAKRLIHLNRIRIEKCDSMQAIITFDTRNVEADADVIVELPNLPELRLQKFPNMTSLCIGDNGTPIQLSLPCLQSLWLHSLGSLQKFCIIGGLHKLIAMTISNCSSLESLVDCGSLDSNTEQVMSFSSLNYLFIENCPNVRAFIRSPTNVKRPLGEMIEEKDESAQPFFNEMVSFPNVTELQIKGIRCEELWSKQIPHDSFCKLKYLTLVGCSKLQHIAPSCMWTRLRCCLQILRVRSCHLIEVIYEGDEIDTENSKLRALVMIDLDSLKHIWRSDGQPNVPFPNLRQVWAKRCSRLEILFASFTEKFLGQIDELVAESCKDMKLIAGHEECEGAFSRTITFSNLSTLGLLELPQFRSLLPEKYSPKFPSLQVLNRKSCGNEPDQHLGDWGHYQNFTYFFFFGHKDGLHLLRRLCALQDED